MERAISGLPRRCEADAWEEEQRGLYRARRSARKPSSAHFIFRNDKGNPPRGISFIFRGNLFAAAKIFPRGDLAANLSLRAIFAEVLRLPQSPWVTAPSKREPRRGEMGSLKTTSHPGEGARSLPLFRAFLHRFLSGRAGINLLLKC